MREAAAGGADLMLTPECTNIVSLDRERQRAVLVDEAGDPTLARLREVAAELGVWLVSARSACGAARWTGASSTARS